MESTYRYRPLARIGNDQNLNIGISLNFVICTSLTIAYKINNWLAKKNM